jgi:hypothetical protein
MKMPAEMGILLFERPIILPAAGYHRNLKKKSSTVVFMPCRGALGGGLYGTWGCAVNLQKSTQKNAAHILQSCESH